MNYVFPHISHISQALNAIKGSDSFYVAERDRHTIINYHMLGNATFPPVITDRGYNINAAIRRECRGIIFGPDGRVIARRFHKFWNAGEKEEVAIEKLNFSKSHVVLEKLDGSMITPFPINDHIRWGTKLGLTDVGFQAEEFVSTRPEYIKYAQHCIQWGKTPIFEWISRKNRIVIDYDRDDLILLAIRDNVTGEYKSYEAMKQISALWGIPVVSALNGIVENGPEFIDGVVNNQHDGLMEGYVVRFHDGHSVKVKTADYVRIHRAKDSILQEKRVVEMIINEKTDDVLPHLMGHDRDALAKFQDDFWLGFTDIVNAAWVMYSLQYERHVGDKKAFALASTEMLHTLRSTIFSVWGTKDKIDVWNHLLNLVKKNLGSQSKVDGIRWIWGEYVWKDYIDLTDENPREDAYLQASRDVVEVSG